MMDIGDDGERGAAATTAAAAPALPKLRVPAAVKERCQPSDIQQTGPTEYMVTSGVPLQTFIDVMGPNDITRCSLFHHKPLAVATKHAHLVSTIKHSSARRSSASVFALKKGAVSFAARIVRSASCRSRCIRSANPLASQMRCRDLIHLHRESAADHLHAQMDRHVHSRT